jgi:hypothetical protein
MTVTHPDPTLRQKLETVEAAVIDARQRRAVAARDRDQAKAAFAAVKGYDMTSPQYKTAQAAVQKVDDIDAELAGLQEAQVGILKLIGGGASPNGHRADNRDVERFKSEPGLWLSSVLDRRKSEIPRLPDDVRFKALTTAANYSTVSESEAVIDLLAPDSVAFAAGIPVLRIDTTEQKIPRFTALPVAAWRNELAPFAKSDGGLEMVNARPSSVGLISELSIEVFDDLTPLALAVVQLGLTRASALAGTAASCSARARRPSHAASPTPPAS